MTTYHNKDNHDDLHSAIEFNPEALQGKFAEDDIGQIVAEVCGENDGAEWYWVISLKNGSYALLSGGCDYTGWDCGSALHVDHINSGGIEGSGAVAAAGRAPETDSYGRSIRQTLLNQVQGEQPFGLYTQKPHE